MKKIAASVDISTGSWHKILTEQLGMSRVCCRWVPRLLTVLQKQNRLAKCQEILERYREDRDNFLNRIITGDQTWLHYYDPKSKPLIHYYVNELDSAYFDVLRQLEKDGFLFVFKKWVIRLNKCIDIHGEYVEKQ